MKQGIPPSSLGRCFCGNHLSQLTFHKITSPDSSREPPSMLEWQFRLQSTDHEHGKTGLHERVQYWIFSMNEHWKITIQENFSELNILLHESMRSYFDLGFVCPILWKKRSRFGIWN
jgi:hypothetical protein